MLLLRSALSGRALRLALTAGIAAASLLVACHRESSSDRSDGDEDASTDRSGSLPAPGTPEQQTAEPANVTGAYLTVTQAESSYDALAPASDAPLTNVYGAAIVDATGKRLAAAPTVASASLVLPSPAPALALTIKQLSGDPSYDFVFRVPAATAAQATDLTVTLTGAGQAGGSLATKPAAGGTAVHPFAYSVFSITRGVGATAGQRIVVLRGVGFSGKLTVVTFGSVPCNQFNVYSDDYASCVTPGHVKGKVTVTATLNGAAVTVPGGYLYSDDLTDDQCASGYDAGNGTSASPFAVCTPSDWAKALVNAASTPFTGYMSLLDNVDLSSVTGTGIPPLLGSGTVSGNGMALLNAKANVTSYHAGLFATMDSSDVHDLTLLKPIMKGDLDAGALAGTMTAATVQNIAIVGGQITGAEDTGGLFGIANLGGAVTGLKVEDTTVTTTVGSAGGIAGTLQQNGESLAIDHLVLNGVTLSASGQVGGFAGVFLMNETFSLTNAQVNVTVHAQATSLSETGGLFGMFWQTLVSSTSTATLDGVQVVFNLSPTQVPISGIGGIAGLIEINGAASIKNTLVSGAITASGASAMGGLVGTHAAGKLALDNVVSTVALTGDTEVGGLIGQTLATLTINNSAASGALAAGSNLGGLVGVRQGTASGPLTITQSLALGALTVTDGSGSSSLDPIARGTETCVRVYWSLEANPKLATSDGDGASPQSLANLTALTAGWNKTLWAAAGAPLAQLATGN